MKTFLVSEDNLFLDPLKETRIQLQNTNQHEVNQTDTEFSFKSVDKFIEKETSGMIYQPDYVFNPELARQFEQQFLNTNNVATAPRMAELFKLYVNYADGNEISEDQLLQLIQLDNFLGNFV